MNTMTVRDKTYCQVEPETWQQCPQVREMAATDGAEILIILALAAVAAAVAVAPSYFQRLGEIERDTEIIKGAMD